MTQLSNSLQIKLAKLEDWYSKYHGSIVAFSGGIDSTLVLYLARKFQGRNNVIAVISNSESLKQKDFHIAQKLCSRYDIKLEVIKTTELNDQRYNSNPVNRCFFCKENLYTYLNKIAEKYPEFKILSGTNYDDLGDYRPGIDAAKKLNILSPLVECRITKNEIRKIAHYFNLPNRDKPASPCLSSRIPYGQKVTKEKLKQVELAENILNDFGFNDVRVRHYDSYGKIEVLKKDLQKFFTIKEEIIPKMSILGFQDIVIDNEGLVSGKLNQAIEKTTV